MNNLERIATIKTELAAYELKTKPLEEELKQLVFALQQEMQESKSLRTEPVNGYYAIRQTRKSTLVDPETYTEWLKVNNYDVAEFMTPDTKKAEALASKVLQEDGEVIPGVLNRETEYVTIREAK